MWDKENQERLVADLKPPKRKRADPLKVKWLKEPDPHDYAAAEHYLSLLADPDTAHNTAEALQSPHSSIEHRMAKDILRAARLPLLDQLNAHVAADLKKVAAGKPLSPILLVRGDVASGLPLEVADGYHRVCASYHLDENTEIPCRLTDWDWVVAEVDYDKVFESVPIDPTEIPGEPVQVKPEKTPRKS